LEPDDFGCAIWRPQRVLRQPRVNGIAPSVGEQYDVDFGGQQVDHAGQCSTDPTQRTILQASCIERDP
jgi:hypothetical protein